MGLNSDIVGKDSLRAGVETYAWSLQINFDLVRSQYIALLSKKDWPQRPSPKALVRSRFSESQFHSSEAVSRLDVNISFLSVKALVY